MRIDIIVCVGIAMAIPVCAAAQPPDRAFAPEVSVSLAWGHLFRFEDRTFGDRPNVGVTVGIRHQPSRVGLELEVNRTLGLTPGLAPCGLVDIPCLGTGREGVRSSTIASANVSYTASRFSSARVQPYVTGGIGMHWSNGFSTITFVGGREAIVTEELWTDRGFAINVGGGVRLAITRALFIRPEVRFYESTLRSRQNLALIRTSIGAAYTW